MHEPHCAVTHVDATNLTAGHFELYPGNPFFEKSLEAMKEFLLQRAPPV